MPLARQKVEAENGSPVFLEESLRNSSLMKCRWRGRKSR